MLSIATATRFSSSSRTSLFNLHYPELESEWQIIGQLYQDKNIEEASQKTKKLLLNIRNLFHNSYIDQSSDLEKFAPFIEYYLELYLQGLDKGSEPVMVRSSGDEDGQNFANA
jgi:hypothetical protein